MDLKGRYVGILGYARSGRALRDLLDRVGGRYFISDVRSVEGAHERGENTYRIMGTDIISPSPGIPPHNRILRRAEASSIPIISELELGWRYLSGKVIAITGTNGKSTVAHFTHSLLKGSFVGGNWGVPVSSLAFREGIFVLEVSSFQLHYIRDFRPDVAVLTNVSPDHLDWHGSFQAYLFDKLRIFQNQRRDDLAILNLDDPYFPIARGRARGDVMTVSLTSPKADYYSDGRTLFTPHGKAQVPPHLGSVPNLYNLLMALAAASAVADGRDILESIGSLRPLPHRVEPVGEVDGVVFYDDSKGTNPGATSMALRSFAGKVILIMGGDDKGLDLSVLEDVLGEKAAVVIAMGRNRYDIERMFSHVVPVIVAEGMGDAVRRAFSEAKRRGLPVLLSPACASFDMFKNYAHRSRVFREEVEKLRRRTS